MRHFSISNWARFQHYKDRDPTWLKLHRSLLSDYRWSQLPDEGKGQLIGLWLIAARTGNRIPADPAWLGNQIGTTEPVDLDRLVDGGWIVWADTDTQEGTLATCYQSASDVLAEPATDTEDGQPTGEQSPGSSDVLALARVCGHPPAQSRETETEREKERENLGNPSGGREAGAPPSFLSFNQEQREQVDALARLRLAKRSEQA